MKEEFRCSVDTTSEFLSMLLNGGNFIVMSTFVVMKISTSTRSHLTGGSSPFLNVYWLENRKTSLGRECLPLQISICH